MCFSVEREWKKAEGGGKVVMSCPDCEPGTPRSLTMGPIDASHRGYKFKSTRPNLPDYTTYRLTDFNASPLLVCSINYTFH